MHTGEDPFNQTLDPNAHGKEIKTKSYYYGEEVGYWNHGDTALIVNTPKYGRKVFTGKTHMPSPSKVRWVTNVNILNNAKHHYDMVRNVDPNIEMIVTQDIEMTSDVNHADIAFACNSWMEFTYPEMTATVSNPWVQIWKGGIRPLYDTRNDADTFGAVAVKLTEMTGDVRIRQVFHFVYMNRVDVYVQRTLDASATCYGYSADVMLKSEKGWMVMGRTYPRHPLWEETNESKPQWTRSRPYRDLPGRTGSDRVRGKLRRAPGRAGSDTVSAQRDHDEQPVRPPGRLRDSHHGAAPRRQARPQHQAAVGGDQAERRTRCGRRGTSSTA